MYDHIGLRVKNAAASGKFFAAALKPLGFVANETATGFGPPGAPALWLHETKKAGGGVHVAFVAKDRKAVDAFYVAALNAGGRDNGRPGLRADYSPTYYAAFVVDPDGNNVEAVCIE
ncbi:MAG: VOC family protein [Alphaproteobacteria bacterium]|nr:VOC family protein [Alphaproteobacteria bacterium]